MQVGRGDVGPLGSGALDGTSFPPPPEGSTKNGGCHSTSPMRIPPRRAAGWRQGRQHHVPHVSQGHHPSAESAQCLGSADIPLTSANGSGDGIRRRHDPGPRRRCRPRRLCWGVRRNAQIEEHRCTTTTRGCRRPTCSSSTATCKAPARSGCSPRPTSASTRRSWSATSATAPSPRPSSSCGSNATSKTSTTPSPGSR